MKTQTARHLAKAIALVIPLFVAASLSATQSAKIIRTGSFETVTAIGGDQLTRFLMSADASAAVYMITEAAEDPRGCFSRQQLHRVDLADGTDVVIEQGFTYDTGGGQGCASNLWGEHFDVSDDGLTIAFVRLVEVFNPSEPANPYELPQLVACDFDPQTDSCAKTVLLETLPYINYGVLSSPRINPKGFGSFIGGDGGLTISGDGDTVFFVNDFGPCGQPKIDSELLDCFTLGNQLGPSNRTIYRIPSAGGSATVVLETSDVALISGVESSVTWIESLPDVDETGSTLVTSLTCCSVAYLDVVVMDVALGLTSARSIAKSVDDCCDPGDPRISADGRTVAFTRHLGSQPSQTGGLHIQHLNTDLSPLGSPLVVDPQWSANRPCLAADGQAVGLFDGVSSVDRVRWASTDAAELISVDDPIVDVLDANCRISADGQSMLIYGRLREKGADTSDIPTELLLFRWGASVSAPQLSSVTVTPTTWFAREPGLQAWIYHLYEWGVTPANPSQQLLRGYMTAFDGRAQPSIAIYGVDDFYGFLDDGTSPDFAAGDLIYTDAGLWLDDDYPSTDPAFPFPDTEPVMRFGVVADDGTAVHADIGVSIYPAAIANRQTAFGSGDSSPTEVFGTGVTLDFSAHDSFGWVTVRRFDFPVPASTATFPGFWQLESRALTQRGGGPALGNFSTHLSFVYDPADVAAAGFSESQLRLWMSTDCVNWIEIPSTVSTSSDTITTTVEQSQIDGLWTLSDGTPIEGFGIFSDGFEAGTLNAWWRSRP